VHRDGKIVSGWKMKRYLRTPSDGICEENGKGVLSKNKIKCIDGAETKKKVKNMLLI